MQLPSPLILATKTGLIQDKPMLKMREEGQTAVNNVHDLAAMVKLPSNQIQAAEAAALGVIAARYVSNDNQR